MAVQTVPPRSAAVELAALLDSAAITGLIAELEATRWTGRRGYPLRAMVGMALAKSLYAIPTWTRTVALVREHTALQAALGCEGNPPSEWACYRFATKLREHGDMLDACIGGVLTALRKRNPGMGTDVAIDGSDLPAYANGQRFVSKGGRERSHDEYSDQDASWGHRSAVSTRKGGGYYGYKVHAAVDTATGLPLAWEVRTASEAETIVALPLIELPASAGSRSRRPSLTRATTTARSTTGAWTATCVRSRRCARRPASSGATTTPRAANMVSGRLPEPTSSGGQRSGAARPASASPPHGGSRPTGCTR